MLVHLINHINLYSRLPIDISVCDHHRFTYGLCRFYKLHLSIKWIYFVFMGFTTADIGRRVGALMMAIFAKPMEKSRNIGKGFIGTGVIMILIFVFYIGLLIYKHSWSYIDFSTLLCGIWFIIYGRISEDEDL